MVKENNNLNELFEFREVRQEEADQTVKIEQICFPPNEACSEIMMKERVAKVPEMFLVAVDRKTKKIAGFINGIATDENTFRDEFFSNANLHNPKGKNVMILGLEVLPQYRGQGLAREIMLRYINKEREESRKQIFLTCLASKVEMYEKMGFQNGGISKSTWGDEEWYDMSYLV